MNRRDLLRAAGASLTGVLAGCSGVRGDGTATGGDDGRRVARRTDEPTATPAPSELSSGTSSPTDRGTATPERGPRTPAPERCVGVVGTSPPSAAPVRYALSVDPPTSDRPPVLRTRIENTGSEPILLGEGRLVRHYHLRSEGGELSLFRPTAVAETGSGCWGLEPFAGRSSAYETLELAAGGAVTARSYVLGADRGTGPCLPPGTHGFQPRVFWSGTDGFPGSDDGRPIDWSFVLGVGEGPGCCRVVATG